MSAENFMAIKKIGDKWHVWMVLGGHDAHDWGAPRGPYHKKFDDESEAHHYAHKVCGEVVVEYGVVVC